MRKLIVLEFMTLDGVIQSGGRPEEDTEGNFKYGGWAAPFDDDEVVNEEMQKQLSLPFDLLLGRKTFDIWEPYWPKHSDYWPGVMSATKYVVSNSRTSSEWQPTVFLSGDIIEKIKELKQMEGPDLHCYGSANLVQTLMKHDLIDELRLKTYPITIGSGKRLFQDGTVPAAFKAMDSKVSPRGIVIVNYERDGDVKTGSIEG